MSTEQVGEALQQFLNGKEAQAIALTGGWGRGKSHFWDAQVKAYLDSAAEPLPISYVSLFGLNSIADVKDAIFENTEKFSEEPPADSILTAEVNSGLASYLWKKAEGAGRKLLPYALKLPDTSQYGAFAKAAAFKLVGKQIICLDDLERKGDGLKPKDIFGLVSFLKEQRTCKVIVIFNDDALGDDKAEFETHREKVFDFEIKFSPSSKECCDIAFNGMDASLSYVAECSQLLQITNIRILRRIKSVVEHFAPLCAGYHPDIMMELIQAAALLTWAYNKEPSAPPYEPIKLLMMGWSRLTDKNDKEIVINLETKKILENYPYTSTDEMDMQVCHYLENGFIDRQLFASTIAKKNKYYADVEGKNRISAFRDILISSFNDNANEVIGCAVNCVDASSEWMDVGTIHHIIVVMRKLGRDDIASTMIRTWVSAKRQYDPECLTLKDYPWRSQIKDKEFIDALAAEKNSALVCLPIDEIAERLVKVSDWDDNFKHSISQVTEDSLYKLFKETQSNRLHLYAEAFITINGGTGYPLREYVDLIAIHHYASAALDRIANENALNRLRVEMYMPKVTDGDAEIDE